MGYQSGRILAGISRAPKTASRCGHLGRPGDLHDLAKLVDLEIGAHPPGIGDRLDDAAVVVGIIRSRMCFRRRCVITALPANITPEEAELRMIPINETGLSDDDTIQVLKIVENLEDLDDVQNVFSNLSISDSVMAQLEAA